MRLDDQAIQAGEPGFGQFNRHSGVRTLWRSAREGETRQGCGRDDERLGIASRRDGAEVIVGNAAVPGILAAVNMKAARRLIVTIPEAFEAGQVVEQARAADPSLEILTRAHSDAAMEHLDGLGANLVVSGEREIAERMLDRIREEGA